ncbi:MAG: hypothetical protein M1819_004831 [Sarea resinae]|nr:MAG: hypothetical protein M1819_004831 [Sarea resinae]
MFPQVIQQPQPQPHSFLSRPYHALNYNSVPSSPSASTTRNLPRNGSNPRHPLSASQIQQQYAYSLQRTNSYPLSHEAAGGGTDASEHKLRRKTPNGTLSAGYDGTPPGWPSDPHTIKHMAMNHHVHAPQSIPADDTKSLPIRQLPAESDPRYHSTNEQLGDTSTQNTNIQGYGMERPGASWVWPVQYMPGADSVLNQVPMQTYLLPDGQQIPTVLQPPQQPGLGPTISNSAGPYGPYWPNGAFVPYRPAALRDPRYSAHAEVPRWPGIAQGDQLHVHPRDWAQSVHMPPLENHHIDSGLDNSCISPNALGAVNFNGFGSAFSPKSFRSPSKTSSRAYHSQLSNSTRQANSLGFMGEASQPHMQKSFGERSIPLVSLETNHDPGIATGSPAANADFKERLLSWSHSVYVDLLASLHHSQRAIQRGSQANGHHQRPRASIYPRPPRQPGTIFTSHGDQTAERNNGRRREHGKDEHVHKRLKDCPDVESPIPAGGRDRDHSRLEDGTSTRQHSYRDNVSLQYQQRRQSLGSSLQHPSGPSDHGRTHRRMSGTIIVPVVPRQHYEASVSANALSALEMLTQFCEESGWQWVDGMLLGGCLAYGLADYNGALGWYSKILDLDHNNVEAISNLAATLLSLNRREEAEHYWLRAVKLRPSYFEAVEHLIGLLCGDHRGKEAVGIIDFVERSLRLPRHGGEAFKTADHDSECSSLRSRSSSMSTCDASETIVFEYERNEQGWLNDIDHLGTTSQPGFGSSGYAIAGSENGRLLALVHAKGNMLYALGDNSSASKAFEDAVLISAGRRAQGIKGLISRILAVVSQDDSGALDIQSPKTTSEPILLPPELALQTAKLVFPHNGELPGLRDVPEGIAKKAAISTTSNSLLSLAKIFQDGMASSGGTSSGSQAASGVRDILALYYLSLALQPSPSTANNVGILLASVQQSATAKSRNRASRGQLPVIPGVVPGSGIALALAYYNYGLNLDSRHAHLYTNLGSLLKDIGQLTAAIKMYEQAVACDGNFDIALANLANAVKDQGRISDAIVFYKRAVAASPGFAEAVCGLANALNSVCAWVGRGGITCGQGKRDRWHVDEQGMLLDATDPGAYSAGWMKRVVDIVEKQLHDGESWGMGTLNNYVIEALIRQVETAFRSSKRQRERRDYLAASLKNWRGKKWEGARFLRVVERATKLIGWQWYQDEYVRKMPRDPTRYSRPHLPSALPIPSAPTVLPFHTFTCPLSAKQIRMISERNALRISCSTLRAPWLPNVIYRPPKPPAHHLNVGYVSSDFNNHPLAHLMQSVFGLHDRTRVKAFCYATTISDNSIHRLQIEREAPCFHDASSWSVERLVNQIVQDGIHILINLNGYTRGARNEVFAARPAPIQMSFMGFAGTLGAEWCDYLLADETAIPPETLRPWRRNVDFEDLITHENCDSLQDDWVYSENIIFLKDTFFCCDHRQSAPDSQGKQFTWEEEQVRRWQMRKELFPTLSDDTVILGNFNQLYKIEPTTFRTWLRILARVPKAVLWLLRFPDLGEKNLKQTAMHWAGAEVASRIIFMDVAPKHQHISRARVCDLFLDTPECNAHTTAADVLWSGTPLLTLPRYKYKLCSRMAASILKGALPKTQAGDDAAAELIARSDEEYEERAVALGNGLSYSSGSSDPGEVLRATGRLAELRKLLYESRWSSALFDTKRWVRDLEDGYVEAWRKWVAGEGGDIWM